MILTLPLSISISHFISFSLKFILILIYLILRDLLIAMVSVCFMRSSSSLRVFLLTRILVKHYFRGSELDVIAIWQDILLRFHFRAERLSWIPAWETVFLIILEIRGEASPALFLKSKKVPWFWKKMSWLCPFFG